ncbi:MAG: hypothetical protein RLZZ28_529 [Bacteroidota bacterium]
MADKTDPDKISQITEVKIIPRYIKPLLFCILFSGSIGIAMPSDAGAADKIIVVDINGGGDFKSIQDAINSLPEKALSPRIIFIKNGIYREKIFIEKSFVSLVGEDKEKTRILISLARDIWRCEHPDDWGVATINLKGNDLVLENLSISNDFGFDHINDKEGIHIDCPGDSLNHFKTVKRDGHQMALRSFGTTRLIVRNCILRAFGGDTVSPWNTEEGMFYFKNCLMEGGVDFYCPRGWAYAENCVFVAHGKTAAIWHDGSRIKDSKTVLKDCVFRGDDGFKLGRYHRDAQFYLLNCSFPANMADTPIYLNPSSPQNIIQWGHRVYFANCHRVSGDYAWFADNLSAAPGKPLAGEINPAWTFQGKWNPSAEPISIPATLSTANANPGMVTTDNTHIDTIAENMLLYQRAIGGWPKAVNEIKVDYKARLTETDKKNIRNDSLHNDATIDNNATSKEIRYLVNAYKKTGNEKYLAAAEKGIYYCLLAQRNNGGWPQYYPDSSLYRGQITFNDDAMINVMDILQDIVEGKKGFELVGKYLVSLSANAIQRGVACILKTQIKTGNQLTAWCAQYNPKTFEPEMARKFELASLSGSESVGIIRFLMRLPNPSPQIKESVMAAVEWLGMVKITGYSFGDITNADGKKDRVLQSSPNNSIWARFYEIGSNKPIFSGRDSIKKYDVKEIESERRNGYAWYGTWPKNLLEKEYPEWAKKNLIKS